MMIIKNIIKATIATTAVISSAFAMVLPGNALSPVTYKAAGYKIQFVDISINCISGTYKPFWAVSYTY